MKKLLLLFFFPFLLGGPDGYIIEMVSISEIGRDEYAPRKFDKGLLFSVMDKSNYSNLYYSEIIDKDKLGHLQKVKFDILNNHHIGTAEYCSASRELIFTGNNSERYKGINRLALFRGVFTKGTVNEISKLDFCSARYNYSYPTLSENGLTLIFSSNIKDGKHLLHRSKRDSINGEWSSPELIDELDFGTNCMFPNLINDSLLVFAANMDKYGKGGLDIYKSKYIDGHWSSPENWEELNSEYDDFGVEMMDEKSGYFTSHRNFDKDKIYYFEIPTKK
ncbi:MAG TPA: hypothetical protein ENJ95_24750 [Bacteroidetes bacterium]|nr:hypothetical protein [Bacteroidota bacterium]